ncbi:aspartate dehydrogenase domain-containing protein [Halorussus salinisoli]|uniref:aspartate dehydrogenase domain-containing protein n=1 Tax=Halorussus salinisoli TaxID=2558242 RepID=UPI0010C242EF|nr:aspartate dehydrogenase domain-containing protein [Halorussus salinisoli]
MLEIGLIGTGAIGSRVASAVTDGMVPDARIASVHNRTRQRASDLVDSLETAHEIHVASDPIEVAERTDVVVETANQAVIEEYAVDILAAGTDLVALSVGAFRDAQLLADVEAVAAENDARVRVPSGSIAGLDGLGAIGNYHLDEVALLCYRPAHYYGPYVDDSVDLDDLEDGDVIFAGTAAEAAGAFPAHMNVAVTVALTAGVDPEDVTVRIEVESTAPRARYVVRARGAGGTVDAEVLNFRTESNPETSHINVLSIVETLRRLSGPVVVGT